MNFKRLVKEKLIKYKTMKIETYKGLRELDCIEGNPRGGRRDMRLSIIAPCLLYFRSPYGALRRWRLLGVVLLSRKPQLLSTSTPTTI